MNCCVHERLVCKLIMPCDGDNCRTGLSFTFELINTVDNRVTFLRIFRVFRVVRLVRRLGSLRVIITSVRNAVGPVFNASCVLALLWALYAVLAVQLYRDIDPERFATFLSAATTLFQVAAGDAWISTVVKPLSEMHGKNDVDVSYPFFMSYYFLSSIVLFNIIVAVLLDEFISAATLSKFEQRMERSKGMAMVLEPLLSPLSAFRTPFDLERSITAVFNVLDEEDKGSLSFVELQVRIRLI